MNYPKVSVIIPFYNCPYIKQALESALGQTYGNVEIILVDDGSSKNVEKIEPYLQLPNLRYILKANGGTASALNTGIVAARGDYFVWLSADDVMQRDKVERQLHFMQERDAYFSFTAFSYLDEYSRAIGGPVVFRFVDKLSFFRTMMKGCPINGSSVMIRMSVFASIGMFDESLPYTHDYDLWLRMLPHYEFYYFDEPLLLYRVHDAMGTKVHETEILHEISLVQARHQASVENLINWGEF